MGRGLCSAEHASAGGRPGERVVEEQRWHALGLQVNWLTGSAPSSSSTAPWQAALVLTSAFRQLHLAAFTGLPLICGNLH